MAASKKSRTRRKKLDPKVIEGRAYRKDIREIFRNVGFEKVNGVSDQEIHFRDRTGDFDDIFIYENIIVMAEYTVSASKIGDHLNKKKILFDKVLENPDEFIEYLETKFETFKNQRNSKYSSKQCYLVIIYCSKNDVERKHKILQPNLIFLDYPNLKYFLSLTRSIYLSSKYEIFDFLKIEHKYIGENYLKNRDAPIPIQGSVLPEDYSNYSEGFKLVTFYIEPDVLLRTSYILRKQGWRDPIGLYQRMISRSKIKGIRKYLIEHRRVFINNIIATLPPEARILDTQRNPIDSKKLTRPVPVTIEFPDEYNTIGLIDGQHRVFSYYESKNKEEEEIIAKLRNQTNLLVTAIIFPPQMTEKERLRFEAKLFLEINSNQTNASTDLRQTIALILDPFSSESIARAVIARLDSKGPLEDLIQNHFYDTKKLKPSSIVSFGLKPLVKMSGEDSLFYIWGNSKKESIKDDENEELLDEYLKFCSSQLNIFLSAFKSQLDSDQWNTKKMHSDGLLNTMFINSLIICLKLIIRNQGKLQSREYYVEKLKGFSKFPFKNYGGSQYNMMATDIYDKFFKTD
ncbi:MAG: DGQHR domain-containing protein [Bacteroidota bacterium]